MTDRNQELKDHLEAVHKKNLPMLRIVLVVGLLVGFGIIALIFF